MSRKNRSIIQWQQFLHLYGPTANPAGFQIHQPIGVSCQWSWHGSVPSWRQLVGGALRSNAAIDRIGLGIGCLLSLLV